MDNLKRNQTQINDVSHEKIVTICLVEGKTDADVFKQVFAINNIKDVRFLSSGGTNIIRLCKDLSDLITKIQDQEISVRYLAIVDGDWQGQRYCKQLSKLSVDCKIEITCVNLKEIIKLQKEQNPKYVLEDLLFNEVTQQKVSVSSFLDDYSSHPQNYPLVNRAFNNLMKILNNTNQFKQHHVTKPNSKQ